jgi:hypothetical protein
MLSRYMNCRLVVSWPSLIVVGVWNYAHSWDNRAAISRRCLRLSWIIWTQISYSHMVRVIFSSLANTLKKNNTK